MSTIRFYILLLLITCAGTVPAGATGTPDKQLTGIIRELGSADNYSYNLTITSVLQGNPAKKETHHYINYSSREQFISYSGSEEAVLFINYDGMFKADLLHKQVFYIQFNDSTRLQWKKLADNASAALADSVLLSDATVVSKVNNKSMLTYKLKYTAQSIIKEAGIVYNSSRHMVSSISYALVRPLNGASPDITVRQTVTMDHYEQKMPQQVKDILPQVKDVYAYLKKTYPGYTISKL